MLFEESGRLVYRYDAEQLWVEAWGPNAIRVRATKAPVMPSEDWALLSPAPGGAAPTVTIGADAATLTNGAIRATVTQRGKLTVHNAAGTLLLEEYVRNRRDVHDPKCSALDVEAREFGPVLGSDAYHLKARFESVDPVGEKIFGMGQYQQPVLNLKGQDIELAHRNSQASVPFAVSSRGYGFLWNNPAVGRAVFGTNIMSFEAYATTVLDYWVVAGDTPAAIVEAYADATGKVPMMPEYGLGFWQSKLRYSTQEELLEVAREHRRRQLPLDVIVADFFHWPKQGDWKFDPAFWPDPGAMVKELQEMNVELMVSIWPTVDKKSENYAEMVEKGYLVRVDRGVRTGLDFEGDTIHYDATNPGARAFLWDKVQAHYYAHGIKVFWLDEAEPEYKVYDFDNYRYHLGPNVRIGNVYPRDYARGFYEGMTAAGQTNVVNLVRCAWPGSQRYGALVWSGDIASSWSSMRNQLTAGLHMGLAGLPWWTTDIGGFHGGDPNDAAFRELFVRWFQWGAFCPVMRLHGDREPHPPEAVAGESCASGAANEVWSYGPEVYAICVRYLKLREELRPYTRSLMRAAHERGSPLMRPLFYDFPGDARSWEVSDEYMFGPTYLCCPVLAPGQRTLTAYLPPLPAGETWKLLDGDAGYAGGQEVEVACPLESMPVFVRVVS
ncbi:glycoside hydrolase family 31 protein [Niveomyces insectorum RCEF 264]|uniref:Glycoside hydrolase family 31 protein n=1 Tax=Niveomyces insectorum RCEF 264 TaxID=1081102 RepID=A0A167XXR7_9HYPO|nr:glycoside hydrolase family 31 protein [Niveomyces insectorum RCEF 264]